MDKLKLKFMKIVILYIWRTSKGDLIMRSECTKYLKELNSKLEEEN